MSAPGVEQLESTAILAQVGDYEPVELRTVVIDRAGCGGHQLAEALIELGRDMLTHACGNCGDRGGS